MREVVTKVYSFDELSDEAKETAIEKIREWLSNGWDDFDNEAVKETIIYMLAEKFRTPGWDTYGPGDFPGIREVYVTGWSFDRDRRLSVEGRLERGNAPALPWVDGIESVTLLGRYYGTEVEVIGAAATDVERSAMEDAIADVIHDALRAGEEEMEYRTSEECAKDRTGDHEYTEEGHLYP